jgi:hypothetical protein
MNNRRAAISIGMNPQCARDHSAGTVAARDQAGRPSDLLRGAFAIQRDWTYVVITLIVLAALGYSLLGGAL